MADFASLFLTSRVPGADPRRLVRNILPFARVRRTNQKQLLPNTKSRTIFSHVLTVIVSKMFFSRKISFIFVIRRIVICMRKVAYLLSQSKAPGKLPMAFCLWHTTHLFESAHDVIDLRVRTAPKLRVRTTLGTTTHDVFGQTSRELVQVVRGSGHGALAAPRHPCSLECPGP